METPPGILVRQADTGDIADLVALGDRMWNDLHGLTGYFTVDLAQVWFARPDRDPERDSPAAFAGERLLGWAALQAFPPMSEVPCPLVVDLDLPTADRAATIDALLAALKDAAAARIADDTDPDGVLGVMVPVRDTGLGGHMRDLGWTRRRTFYEMTIDLGPGTAAAVEWPQGMTLRTFAAGAAVDPAIDVLVEAFADHPGLGYPPEEWRHLLTADVVLPDASYVLDDAEGPVAALCSANLGDGEGYISAVGVRRRARGRGAAVALLRRAFHDLAAAGFTTAKLDVDAQNATGALDLYERAGMTVRVAQELWVTPLPR